MKLFAAIVGYTLMLCGVVWSGIFLLRNVGVRPMQSFALQAQYYPEPLAVAILGCVIFIIINRRVGRSP